jgi:hypothetical protein
MKIYALRVESPPGMSVDRIRWELFVHHEIRDVCRLVDGTLAIGFEGEEPNVAAWERTLRRLEILP